MEKLSKSSVYKYGNDVVWSLPCMFQYEPIFGSFQRCLSNMGLPLIKANVYGSPATVWSSGRAPLIKSRLSREKLTKLFNYIQNVWHGTPTFTFSRMDITKDLLHDEYANYLLDFGIEHNARFIVSSDILKDYIKNKSPETEVVGSILKSIYRFQGPDKIEEPTVEAETEYVNKLLKEYDIVVVRPEYSKSVLTKNPKLIDDISRIEVLINQLCYSNCPNAPLHSTILSAHHRNKVLEQERTFFCYKDKISYEEQYKHNSAHTYDDVAKLVNAGVKQLKLQGRGEPVPYFEHAVGLAVHMFNVEGPNMFLFNINNYMRETDEFYATVDPQREWFFKDALVGFHFVNHL